ncbi:MAG: DNA translocase FtsK [Dehalococcoidia bacterium]|nr:MAG: DNA translocase FtsK [Dehalococcoidia bacterium]
MAKKKAYRKDKKDKALRKPTRKKSGVSQLFHFILLPPVWRLLLFALVVGILAWQWSALTAWARSAADNIWAELGLGLFLLVLAIGVLLGVLFKQGLLPLIFRWNRWLGSVAFGLALWGVLALLDVGGRFGQDIIGFPASDWVGVLRILGLVLVGIILLAPAASFRLMGKFSAWLGKQFHRKPAPVSPVEARPAPSPVTPLSVTPPVPRPTEVKPVSEEVIPAAPPVQTQPTLREVAQEVWKKYGESQTLVTVDGWKLPPIDILDRSPEIEFSEADNLQRARLIEDALSSYGVEAKVVQINAGPTVTQFGVEPGWDRKMKEVKERDRDGTVRVRLEEVSKTRVKVEKITSLSNDLALALAAPTIRMEAPVPGKSIVGIEVPNTISSSVSLRGVIESSAFQKTVAKSKLAIALGKGAGGEAIAADLDKMPHLLIAGATGSGKTVCLNSAICCLLVHNAPCDVRLIMIDPKRVELTQFNSIPHLAVPVIVHTDKALSSLRWLNQEMDKRYQVLATTSARNIDDYNRNRQGTEKLPYLVLVIDELADLMMAGFDEVEHILCRLAQLARATGIHLIVATQRPSVDVVTGLIKANFPTRISFAVTSQVDSRTILDIGGAEKLLGRGDMLYMPTEAAKPKRLQGCYVSDAEIERLVYFWGSQRKEEAAQLKIEEFPPVVTRPREYPPDPLMDAARQLASEHKRISTSFLQRRLRIGYPRAARIMEQLEEEVGEGEE